MTSSIAALPSRENQPTPIAHSVKSNREFCWETYKAHEFALNFFAMLLILCLAVRAEGNSQALIVKFCLLNALVVAARHFELFYPSAEDGIHLGYLMRGVHDLALAMLGKWDALPSGLFFTYWSLNTIHYV